MKIYNYKESYYEKTGEPLMKNPVTRKWEEGVAYRALTVTPEGELVKGTNPKRYVREKGDFESKFKRYKII